MSYSNGVSKLFVNTFHMCLTCLHGDLIVTLYNTIFTIIKLSFVLSLLQCIVLYL